MARAAKPSVQAPDPLPANVTLTMERMSPAEQMLAIINHGTTLISYLPQVSQETEAKKLLKFINAFLEKQAADKERS
jgi:aromatic ring hydroxylase